MKYPDDAGRTKIAFELHEVYLLIFRDNHSEALVRFRALLPADLLEGVECAIDPDRLARLSILHKCNQDLPDPAYDVGTRPSKQAWRKGTEKLVKDAKQLYDDAYGVYQWGTFEWYDMKSWYKKQTHAQMRKLS